MFGIAFSALVLAVAGGSLFADSASAATCTTNTVVVYNKTPGGLFWAQVFDSNDESYGSPASQQLLNPGTSAELTCNTCGNCLVAVTRGYFSGFMYGLMPTYRGSPDPSQSTHLGLVQGCVSVTAWQDTEATRAMWSGGC